jgi:colicin import membrane protein
MSSLVSRFPADRDPLRPPPAPGLGRGLAVALVAHVLLVAALSFGVSWRSTPIPAAEAELWAAVPVAAAPKEQLPPEESPPPKPEPKPEPPKPQQPTPQEVQAQRDADIAIAKAKERKLKEEQEQREAEEKKRKLEQQKKDEAEKQERDRKEKEAQAKKDKEKDKAEQAEKAKAEKARKDAEARAEQARQENLKRIMGMAGATGAPNATGTAQKSAGPSANYAGRIKARVKPNIVYQDPGGAANPEAEVEVRCSPDGTIIARRILKSSGLPDFDAAVLRALDKTEILPRDTDGTVPRVMILAFKPRE